MPGRKYKEIDITYAKGLDEFFVTINTINPAIRSSENTGLIKTCCWMLGSCF